MHAVKLTVHTEPMSAELVRASLLDAGLHPLPIREAGHVTIPGSGSGYFVFVPEEELEAAIDAVKAAGHERFLW